MTKISNVFPLFILLIVMSFAFSACQKDDPEVIPATPIPEPTPVPDSIPEPAPELAITAEELGSKIEIAGVGLKN